MLHVSRHFSPISFTSVYNQPFAGWCQVAVGHLQAQVAGAALTGNGCRARSPRGAARRLGSLTAVTPPRTGAVGNGR